MKRKYVLPDDTKVCNCAGCNALMLGASHAVFWYGMDLKQRDKFPPLMAGREDGRPYCKLCLVIARGGLGEKEAA